MNVVTERKRNPFIGSPGGGRVLSALMLPWFLLRPPRGFGVLTTTGRRTGKARRKCVRAIRRGDRAYLVAIGGPRAAWLKNLQATPSVRLRIRGGTFAGIARELEQDAAEMQEARDAFCETIHRFDYYEGRMHRPGRPSEVKIKELHRSWFATGTPLVIELRADRG
jgi:deazaflavin-dependent oxidoreductase (nitroreductase family)